MRAVKTPVVRIGWPDQFIEHGKPDDLRAKYGISVTGCAGETAAYLQIAPVDSPVTRTRQLAAVSERW